MNKRILFFIITFLIAGSYYHFFLREKSSSPCPKCNIIIVLFDALRADALPCYGYLKNTTPNICRFANRNTLFTQAYSQASWSLPSHMSFFSSQYLSRHLVAVADQDSLAETAVTLPQALKKAGYQTLFAGPLNDPAKPLNKGLERGFDETISSRTPNDWLPAIETLKKNNKKHIPTFLFLHTNDLLDELWTDIENATGALSLDPNFQVPVNITSAAVDGQLRQAAINYLSNTSEHVEILRRLKQAANISQIKTLLSELPTEIQGVIRRLAVQSLINPDNPSHMAYMRNLYDSRLQKLDASMVPILEILEQKEIAKNTIIVFFSDHGYEFGEHGSINMGANLYPATTHIPFVFSLPGVGPARKTEMAQKIDIYPTVLEAAGVPAPSTVMGRDLTPIILNKPGVPAPKFALSELDNQVQTAALRSSRWTYHHIYDGDDSYEELYDRSSDPKELRDVAQDFPDILERMRAALIAVRANEFKETPDLLLP